MKGVSNKILADFKEIESLTIFMNEYKFDKQFKSRLNKIKMICKKYEDGECKQ